MADDDVAALRARIVWLEAKADEEHGHARAASDEITRLTHEVIAPLQRRVQQLEAELTRVRAQRDWWYDSYGLTLNSECHCTPPRQIIDGSPSRRATYLRWLEITTIYDCEPDEGGREYHEILRHMLDTRMEEDYHVYCKEYEVTP